MRYSKTQIIEVLNEYVHREQDRIVLTVYLTDRPTSLERLAEKCDVSISTVQRVIDRNSFLWKYLPDFEW